MSESLVMGNCATRVVGAWRKSANDDLVAVLQIALNHHRQCVAYSVIDGVLFLYWHATKPTQHPFVAPLTTAMQLHSVVVSWLDAQPVTDELRNSDTDEIKGAFEAWTDQWGHGGGDSAALLAIKPRTRWIGK